MSDPKDAKVDRVVHEARAVLSTRFGLEFLARQYELAAAEEEAAAQEVTQDNEFSRSVADELRRADSKKYSLLGFKRRVACYFSHRP